MQIQKRQHTSEIKQTEMESSSADENPTTSYKSNRSNGALPPMPLDEATPTSLSSSNSNGRGRHSPGPSVTSLLSEDRDAEQMNYHNEGNPSSANERCGVISDGGQRATITGMICRKSKAFMFGQILSLFLVSDTSCPISLLSLYSSLPLSP